MQIYKYKFVNYYSKLFVNYLTHSIGLEKQRANTQLAITLLMSCEVKHKKMLR